MAALQRKLRRDGLPSIGDMRDIVADAIMRLHDHQIEHLLAHWLTRDLRLIGVETLATGGETGAALSTAHIARRALAADCAYVVVTHNHPLGDPTPSKEDAATALAIDRQLASIGVMVLGHYIVARTGTADIRTGTVTLFADLPRAEPTPENICPHCGRELHERTSP